MSTLRQYLDSREREIASQMASLKTELAEIRVAKAAIEGNAPTHLKGTRSRDLGQRGMILKVLDQRSAGGRSDEIVQWVREDFGVDIALSSASSQLSRMKSQDTSVVLDQATKIWRSANQASNGNATAPKETASPTDEAVSAEEGATSSDMQPDPKRD